MLNFNLHNLVLLLYLYNFLNKYPTMQLKRVVLYTKRGVAASQILLFLFFNPYFYSYSAIFLTTSITVPSTHLMAATTSSVNLGLSGMPQILSASSFNS